MRNALRIMCVGLGTFLLACGGSGGGDGEPLALEASIEEANPIARSTQIFGTNGNLYKPVSAVNDSGGGNVVVLLSPTFTKRFDSCEIPLVTGEIAQLTCNDQVPWTQIPYSCFSNGNRQTWRASFRCSSVAEVKVTCRDANQEVTFTVPEEARGFNCTRFG